MVSTALPVRRARRRAIWLRGLRLKAAILRARRMMSPRSGGVICENRAERRIVQSGFHYHYARLIEAMYALERMQELLDDPAILGTKVRAHAGVNNLEGIGVIEAPRGTLFHDYTVDENGQILKVNLIIATGQNNLAMNRTVAQIARRNRISTSDCILLTRRGLSNPVRPCGIVASSAPWTPNVRRC